MSEIKNETIKETVENTVEIKREISQFFVDKTADIFVKIKVTKTANDEFVRWDWYHFPASELASINTSGGSFYDEIKTTLWNKINEIDAMPESTDEEIQAKAERKGQGFKIIM